MKKLLAAWLCVVVVACAASSKQAAMSGAAPPPTAQTMPSNPHDEIEQLSAQIDQERERMNLPAPAAGMAEPMTAHTPSMQAPVAPPHAQDATCHPAASQTCTDSCTLGDSICSNADRICKLADGMAGDDWAAGKCSTAKQTCSDAHKRCCECT